MHQFESDSPTIPHKIVINAPFFESNNSRSYTDVSNNFVVMENYFIVRPIQIYVRPSSVFFKRLEKTILECHQHGLLVKKSDPPELKSADEPQVLTMQMLEAGFVLWMCSICVACVVFICEHIVRYNSKRRRKAREFSNTNTFYAQLMDEQITT